MIKNEIVKLKDITIKNVFKIECKDIVLKEFELEDLDEIYELTLQHEITDFLPDWIATKEKRREWLVKYEINENREFLESVPNISTSGRKALRLAIILKETNQIIGWCCSGFKAELPLPNREIGYAVSKNYRNKGYTTQAAKGLIKYLFENTNLDVLNATALTYNKPSNRVIEKCGFKFINNVEIENHEFYYYKLNKSEWENNMKNFVIDDSTSEEGEIVRKGIIEYNLSKVPFTQEPSFISINKVIKGINGDVLAGIRSELYCWNCLYIDILWVKEGCRHEGYGSALLNEVEKIAKEKGCKLIHLDTFDFQAKDFYNKCGYEVFGVLDDCPLTHKRYYMKKNI